MDINGGEYPGIQDEGACAGCIQDTVSKCNLPMFSLETAIPSVVLFVTMAT